MRYKNFVVKLDNIYENLNTTDYNFIIKLKEVLFNISINLYDKYNCIEILLNNICLIRFDKIGYNINTEIDHLKDKLITYEPFNIITKYIIKINKKTKIKRSN